METKIKIKFNAPATLSLGIISAAVLLGGIAAKDDFSFFMIPGRGGFDFLKVSQYVHLISYIFGHSGWEHFLNNFIFILLLGPMLEEKYGSFRMIFMIFLTAMTGGFVNLVFSSLPLCGSSGIVFMMIVLTSVTNIKEGELPVTFILILIFYLLKEILPSSSPDDVSHAAHLAGALCGGFFGFIYSPGKQKRGNDG